MAQKTDFFQIGLLRWETFMTVHKNLQKAFSGIIPDELFSP